MRNMMQLETRTMSATVEVGNPEKKDAPVPEKCPTRYTTPRATNAMEKTRLNVCCDMFCKLAYVLFIP